MMKIADLIIDGFDSIVGGSMESVRVDMKIPKDEFRELLDAEDGKAYDELLKI